MNKLLTTTALVLAAGAAFGQEAIPPVTIGGEIETVIKETGTDDKWGATTSFALDLDVNVAPASGSLEFVTDADNDVTLDEWSMGTAVAGVGLSFGKQGNVWIDTESGATIEEPTMAESVQVTVAGATVGVGLTDLTADVTDVANIQGSYTINANIFNVTTAGDYNLDSEEWVAAGRVETGDMLNGVTLGGAMSYGSASESIGFEVDATALGITGYLAGDQDEMAEHVGAKYTYDLSGVSLEGAVDYDIENETTTPQLTVSFNF